MARIADLLARGRTFSFEFFPPKTDEARRQLEKAVHELAPLKPSFVSVTYGALGSTREFTRDAVVRINEDQAFPAMPHLTCVGHARGDIDALLDFYAAHGIENILALGGDPPADGSDPGGDFRYATELIEVVRAHPAGFCVGVAAHPEVHPRSSDRAADRRHLAAKLAVADFAITQFSFLPDEQLRLRDELAALGSTTPVIPSVFPVINVAGITRMAAMNGSVIPAPLLERLEAAATPDDVVSIGVEAATDICRQLLEADVPGIHLYPMNRSESIRRIFANLGLGVGR
ncbi:MAG TPA: methylenetetrahydrofolate reductase [Acidimicrobiales bacterium]|jgi:methylenetetrahydrofolate reductase (NADPH)|nr:methylenetetrahydrofolate reductase [Acidimicrobiales bacterium]